MLVSTIFTVCVIIIFILLTVLDIIKKRKDNNNDYRDKEKKGLLFLNPDYVPIYKTIFTIIYVMSILYIVGVTIEFLVNNWNNKINI